MPELPESYRKQIEALRLFPPMSWRARPRLHRRVLAWVQTSWPRYRIEWPNGRRTGPLYWREARFFNRYLADLNGGPGKIVRERHA